MEQLSRFDIAEYGGVLMVVVESDILPPDPAIVVIPLLIDYPAVQYLNPSVPHAERDYVLATRLIGAVQRVRLRRVGTAEHHGDAITRAMDVLMGGV